ncbi:MAG: hypothetical protein ACR2PQ_01880 [Myxococcota bacterium]
MNVRSFGGTLLFGIAAGVGFPGFSLLTAPLLGAAGAFQAWVALGAIAYAALLGIGWRERIVGAFTATAFVVPAALLAEGIVGLVAGAALAVAVARSYLLGTDRIARTVVIEAALAAFGFAFVRSLGGAGLFPIALAIWGWFLVQSLYFLIGGGLPQPARSGDVDAFDLAHERANAIMETE